MPHPVLFAIDDDPGVVRALRDDLGRRFGEDFRIIGASSAAAAVVVLIFPLTGMAALVAWRRSQARFARESTPCPPSRGPAAAGACPGRAAERGWLPTAG